MSGRRLPAVRAAELGIPGATIDARGLRLEREISFKQWQRIGFHLGVLRDLTAWCLGDWILLGEAMFGERVAQGIEITGRQKSTLVEYARVASKVARSRRREGLPWFHHKLVAALEPAEQTAWLERAEANGWSSEQLRGALHEPAAVAQRSNRSRPAVEVLELLEDVARAVLRAAEPLGDGRSVVPDDVLDRLRNALGERAPR